MQISLGKTSAKSILFGGMSDARVVKKSASLNDKAGLSKKQKIERLSSPIIQHFSSLLYCCVSST